MTKNPHDILDRKTGVDVVQQSYSATIDIRPKEETQISAFLSYFGFEVIHEEDTIYTVRYTGWE